MSDDKQRERNQKVCRFRGVHFLRQVKKRYEKRGEKQQWYAMSQLFCFLPSDSLTHKSLPPISAPT